MSTRHPWRPRIVAAALLCLLAAALLVARRAYYERTKHLSRVITAGLAASPDGTKIAFAMRVGDSENVYTLNVDTGELRGLAYGLPRVSTVGWLPSGAAVFVGTDGGQWEIALDGTKTIASGWPAPSGLSRSGRYRVVTSGARGQVLVGVLDEERKRLLPVRHEPGFSRLYWVGDRLLACYLTDVPRVDELSLSGRPPKRLWTFDGPPLLAPGEVGPPDAPQPQVFVCGASALVAPVPYVVRGKAGRGPIAVRIDIERGRVCEAPLGVSQLGAGSDVAISPDGRWLAVRCSGVDEGRAGKHPTAREADLLLLLEVTSAPPGIARRLCIEGRTRDYGDTPRSLWSPDSRYLLAPGSGVVDLAALCLVRALPGPLYVGADGAQWVHGDRIVSYVVTRDEAGVYLSEIGAAAPRQIFRTRPSRYDSYRDPLDERLLRALRLRP